MKSMPKATPVPATRLLEPDDHTLILIDYRLRLVTAPWTCTAGRRLALSRCCA
jgi:hypothetical protein